MKRRAASAAANDGAWFSGCFRTLDGAVHFCVIRSCLDTLRKQGHNMLAVFQQAFVGTPIQSAA
jgi:transposase